MQKDNLSLPLALNQAFDCGKASRLDSIIDESLPEAIMSASRELWPRLAVKWLQLLYMTGLRHGLV